jgi:hypothetical protein
MGIEMFVEIDDHLATEELLQVFTDLGVEIFQSEDHGFSGRFPYSEMFFHVFQEGKSTLGHEVITEECAGKILWTISTRIKFRYVNANFDQCGADIKKFVTGLANGSAANFVLAFQFEKIYAIRDHAGLRFLRDF